MNTLAPVMVHIDDSYYLYDARSCEANGPHLFDSVNLNNGDPGDEPIRGRGAVIRLEINEEWAILRHYRRGGWYAALTDDRYLWTGLERSRPVREWRLLARLYERGFPVPRPIAMRIDRSGLWYRADLITAEIPDARTLAQVLETESLSDPVWARVGEAVARFHAAGVYHSDLNANNIMLDMNQNIYLIDFDKSGIRSGGRIWKRQNLKRLKHSLEKLSHKKTINYWRESDFSTLVNAYRLMEERPGDY